MDEAVDCNSTSGAGRQPTFRMLSPAGVAQDAFHALELALSGLKGRIENGERDDTMLEGLDWLVGFSRDAVEAAYAAEQGQRPSFGLFGELVKIAEACADLPERRHG